MLIPSVIASILKYLIFSHLLRVSACKRPSGENSKKCLDVTVYIVNVMRYQLHGTFILITKYRGGMRWRSWLRHCATSRKVAGSSPNGVIGILHWHNLSGHTVALGSTQPLTEMSTRNISWGVKAAGVQGWQPYHFRVPIVLKSGSLNLLEPSGPVQACNGIALP